MKSIKNILKPIAILTVAGGALMGSAGYNPASADSFLSRLISVPIEVIKSAIEIPASVVKEAGKGDALSVVTSPLYAVKGAVNGVNRTVYSLGHVVDEDVSYNRKIGEDGPASNYIFGK